MEEEAQQRLKFEEIIYEKKDRVAWVTINRPERLNAITAHTTVELVEAFENAWLDRNIRVVVLTGAGNRAFCTGGDQKTRGRGGYGKSQTVIDFHWMIRSIPKPVIAMVRGYAIGNGNVIQVLCDLTIASENAIFGQTGPKVGSFAAGFGSAYLARAVGQKKAREIWYLCRQYKAQEALQMGLVNAVVPDDKLEEEVNNWCQEIVAKSPTAIRALKASFNADTESIAGINAMGHEILRLYYRTDEALEGVKSFVEKRKPDFSKF